MTRKIIFIFLFDVFMEWDWGFINDNSLALCIVSSGLTGNKGERSLIIKHTAKS